MSKKSDIQAEAEVSLKEVQEAQQQVNNKPDTEKKGEGNNTPKALYQDTDFNNVYIDTDEIIMTDQGLYRKQGKGTRQVFDRPIFVKAIIKGDNNTSSRLFQFGIENPVYLNILNSDIVDQKKFTQRLLDEKMYWEGSKADIIKFLRDGEGTVSLAKVINTLGWDNDAQAYFYANLAIDKNNNVIQPNEYGMLNVNGKEYYLPFIDPINPKKNLVSNRMRYVENKRVTFARWFPLFEKMFKNNCYIPCCFLIMACFRDIVYKNLNSQPMLFYYGGPGTGKTTISNHLVKFFGYENLEPISAKNGITAAALPRILDQLSNSLYVLNEFDDEIDDKMKNAIQNIYDGAGRITANCDQSNDTGSQQVRSTIALTSNFIPKHEPFYQRLLFMHILKEEHTPEQKKAQDALFKLGDNFSELSRELLQYRDIIEQKFRQTYNRVNQYICARINKQIDGRYADTMSACLTAAIILIEAKKIEILDPTELIQLGIEQIEYQYNFYHGNSVINDFWQEIQSMFNNGLLKRDYHLRLRDNEELISIYWTEVYRAYADKTRNQAVPKSILFNQLKDLTSFVDDRKQQFVISESFSGTVRQACSTLTFNYQQLKNMYSIDLGWK